MQTLQHRVFGCLERVAGQPMTDDSASDETEEQLRSLAVLVPRLASDLHAMHHKLNVTRSQLEAHQLQYTNVSREWQDAQVAVEEAQVFKARLSEQLVQLVLSIEQAKDVEMTQLFAQVDGTTISGTREGETHHERLE